MAGFGNQTWGYQKWGTLGDEIFTVDGLPLSSNLNSTTVESFVNVGWGSDQWGIETWGESGSNHLVTGLAMTMSEDLVVLPLMVIQFNSYRKFFNISTETPEFC